MIRATALDCVCIYLCCRIDGWHLESILLMQLARSGLMEQAPLEGVIRKNAPIRPHLHKGLLPAEEGVVRRVRFERKKNVKLNWEKGLPQR